MTAPHRQAQLSPVVRTTTGEMQGFVDAGTGQSCFWGIPYAEAPTGDLRFRPTQPKRPWTGIFDATSFGASGPQVFDVTEGSYEEFTGLATPPDDLPWIGSEDNLTLNIWTPEADGKKRPVMVWIHGGANWLESSRLHTYHGDRFVERDDVVFVSLNYRLGVFGWLDVSVLGGDEFNGSHSNGLRDQLCALRWIRDNIGAFGGDPGNITVMGESAGSIDISWLLTNGHLNGIAKRVVMMSGVAGLIGLSGDLGHGFTEDYARERARFFLDKMGVSSIGQLQSMDTAAIMERVSKIAMTESTLEVMDSQFWPRVSPDFTPLDPFRAGKLHGSHGIDVIIGYTAYEMGLWLFWDDSLDRHPCAWSAEKLTYPQRSRIMDEAPALYAQTFAGEAEGVQGMNLVGDSIFVMPSYYLADLLAERGENVRLFQFDWKGDERRGALHASDQAFMFGKLDTHAASHLLGTPHDAADRKKREQLSQAMMDCFLSYAGTGVPAQGADQSIPEWPFYDAENRMVLSFDYTSAVLNDPVQARRDWWYRTIYDPALASE